MSRKLGQFTRIVDVTDDRFFLRNGSREKGAMVRWQRGFLRGLWLRGNTERETRNVDRLISKRMLRKRHSWENCHEG
eukprot:8349926-Pyramimonas_sp.AAC.1